MRLVVFDRTQGALTRAWSAGGRLYRGLGRIDATRGCTSWGEALDWVLAHDAPLDELQFWGHGKWGAAFFARDALDAAVLAPAHPLHDRVRALGDALAPGALVWLRCCEVFGASRGHELAQRLADGLGARVAGHTFVIGFYQSGLHALEPGARPDWPADEGLAAGSPDAPERAHGSGPRRAHTITCLARAVPDAWVTR